MPASPFPNIEVAQALNGLQMAIRLAEQDLPGDYRKVQQAVLAQAAARGMSFSNPTLSKVIDALAERFGQLATELTEQYGRFVELIGPADLDQFSAAANDMIEACLARAELAARQKYLDTEKALVYVDGDFGPQFTSAFTKVRQRTTIDRNYLMQKYRSSLAKQTEMTVHNYLTGPNPRVNINSQDYSVNVAAAGDLLSELRKAVESGIPDNAPEKNAALSAVDKMVSAGAKTRGFGDAYKEFMAVAANHVAVFGGLMPSISQMLP